MNHAGNQRSQENGPEQGAASIALLQRGAQNQNKHHVIKVMGIVGMAQHMQEKAHICADIGKG